MQNIFNVLTNVKKKNPRSATNRNLKFNVGAESAGAELCRISGIQCDCKYEAAIAVAMIRKPAVAGTRLCRCMPVLDEDVNDGVTTATTKTMMVAMTELVAMATRATMTKAVAKTSVLTTANIAAMAAGTTNTTTLTKVTAMSMRLLAQQ